MAAISGSVYFDRDRSAALSAGDTGLAGIPVVLQNRANNRRLTVLTDAAGGFSFYNLPAGEYRLVEAYGAADGIPSPGNFQDAVVGPIPVGVNPPITAAANPPPGATNLDSVTPDTLFLTVGEIDQSGFFFFNGPVIYSPIEDILDPCALILGTNPITAADEGTFGSFPAGTPANTGVAIEPYPGVVPDFRYVLPTPKAYSPYPGEYTVQNIMSNSVSAVEGNWWRIADHTTGNETGRMMIVNGNNPGAVFFRAAVPVLPDRSYLFTAWILNLVKVLDYADPKLGVRVLDQKGGEIYSASLGAEIPTNPVLPEWKQVGSIINSLNNTELTVEFLSEGPEEAGNDYAIDDIAFHEIALPHIVPEKRADISEAEVGESFRYTVTMGNPCRQPLTGLFFRDELPEGFSFIPGSLLVNGNPRPDADPNAGFILGDLPGGNRVEVTFEVKVDRLPDPNPAINRAVIDYRYSPVEGGIPMAFEAISNALPVEVISPYADLSAEKSAPVSVNPGELLLYTVTLTNAGPSAAGNTVFLDDLPVGLSDWEISHGGGNWQPFSGRYDLGTMPPGTSVVLSLRGRVTAGSGFIRNIALVESSTPDPNPDNNYATAETEVAASLADLSISKRGQPAAALPGELLTYTLTVTNRGPGSGEAVLVYDTLPPELIDTELSLDGGTTWTSVVNPIPLGRLSAGESRILLLRGTVAAGACGIIANTAVVTGATPDPDPGNNTSSVNLPVKTGADLSLRKAVETRSSLSCCNLVYRLTVTNRGPQIARQVTITDKLPAVLSRPVFSTDEGKSWRAWSGSYTLSSLPVNTAVSILVAGHLSSCTSSCIYNEASVRSVTPDPDLSNNSDCVTVCRGCTCSSEREEERGSSAPVREKGK